MARAAIRLATVAPGLAYHVAYVPVSVADAAMHRHVDFSEMFYVAAGCGRHQLPSGSQSLAAGDLVLVGQHHEHGFASTAADPLALVNVAFSTAHMRAFLGLAELQALGNPPGGSLPVRVRLTEDDRQGVAAAFERMLMGFDRSPSTLDLIRFWIETLPLLERALGPVDAGPGWLGRACLGMEDEENLRGGITRMLELASVSHGHLSRSMMRHYGTTPTQFITSLRIQLAARLLRQTDLPVAEISMRCGFSTPSYFSRQFHRVQGMSPRSFRALARTTVVQRRLPGAEA